MLLMMWYIQGSTAVLEPPSKPTITCWIGLIRFWVFAFILLLFRLGLFGLTVLNQVANPVLYLYYCTQQDTVTDNSYLFRVVLVSHSCYWDKINFLFPYKQCICLRSLASKQVLNKYITWFTPISNRCSYVILWCGFSWVVLQKSTTEGRSL